MTSSEIRTKFLEFFKARGHAIVPSSSLVPDVTDTTTLFTSAGMQPMVPYLLGALHPQGKRIVNSQRCFRAQDIEEVGDNRHTTFFEMLGNWSFGDYFKQEQLEWIFTFLTDKKEGVGLKPEKLYVTVFSGNDQIPRDDESVQIWKKLFNSAGVPDIKDVEDAETKGIQGGRIFYYGEEKNWWSLAGVPSAMPASQPGGPDSEIFYEFSDVEHNPKFGAVCHVNCDCGRYLEIGNNVFMEYIKNDKGSFDSLPQKNVDFGGGLERITTASIDSSDVFKIDSLKSLVDELPSKIENIKIRRIIADHIRAASYLISDGVEPSNKDRGYVVRRLLRRAIFHVAAVERTHNLLGHEKPMELSEKTATIILPLVDQIAKNSVKELNGNMVKGIILKEIGKSIDLLKSQSEFRSIIDRSLQSEQEMISGKDIFYLSSSFGIPFDYIKDEAERAGLSIDEKGFNEERTKHQEISRAGFEAKFGGHGLILNTGELKAANEEEVKIVTRLHTATHLLQQALRDVLGPEVQQAGSDITAERTRFDFTFGRKLTPEEIKKVEARVNEKIKEDLPVTYVELPRAEAEKTGALFFFKAKYGDIVKVYYMGDSLETAWSKEFCGGPHVNHTAEVGEFKIVKEEAVSAGVRRIRGTVS